MSGRDAQSPIPPHDLAAEASVLSAALIDPACLDLIEYLKPHHFYSEAHARIWEAILAVRTGGQPVDVVTVGGWLRDRQRIGQVGGMPYLTEILNAVPSIPDVDVYGKRVVEKAQVRRMITKTQLIAAVGYTDYGDAAQYLATAERDVGDIARDVVVRDRRASLSDLVSGSYQRLDLGQRSGRPGGIRTGFHELDKMTVGLHRGELTVVAGRPGMGKTSFVMALIENIAKTPPQLYDDLGRPGQMQGALFFSLEMPREQIGDRWMASHARYELRRLRSYSAHDGDWAMLAAACSALSGLAIVVDDTTGLTLDALRAAVRRERTAMARKGVRLSVVGIDYLQLMRGVDTRASREQEISLISRGLKGLAKDEEVPVIALAQLNRDVEKRAGAKRPCISDLRESGAIEQDADNILFLYRPEYYGESVLPEETGKTDVIIAKQRNGPTGTIAVRFVPEFARFENM